MQISFVTGESLNIVTWNARGIRHKSQELFEFLIQNNVHICLVTETWLNCSITLNHRGYYIYRNDRETRGGGVAIIIKNSIRHELLPVCNTHIIENIGIKVPLSNDEHVNIFSCYFKGGRSRDIVRRTFASDLRILSSFDNYILGGDFNCRHSLWGCNRANCWGNILLEKLESHNITLSAPTDPTYIPSDPHRLSSTLDLFLSNIPETLSTPEVLNALGSDHLPVKVVLNKHFCSYDNFIYDYKHANWNRFSQYVNRYLPSIRLENLISNEQIDSAILKFNKIVYKAIKLSVPKKLRQLFRKPFPNHIKELIRLRNYHRHRWQRFKNLNDELRMKNLNLEISREIINFRNRSWNHLLSTLDKSSSPFWNLTKIIRKKNHNIPLIKHNGVRYITNQQKSEILAQTFGLNHEISVNLSNHSTITEVNDSIDLLNSSPSALSNTPITSVHNVALIIKSLKNKKAPGNDRISNKILKALPNSGIKYLTTIINACFKLGYFPNVWKESKVVPIKKPNKPPTDAGSYRPISLLSSASKILEKVLKRKMEEFVETQNILPKHQFGFRSQHCTTQPLTRIYNHVTSNFSCQKSTGMVLLDIKAAFDSVWHNGLVHKLIKFNFPRHLVRLVQSFLNDRSFRVHIGSSYSERKEIRSGCPQGSCLSPLLYNLYTADFPQLENCMVSVFADDTAILSSAVSPAEITANLQTALTAAQEYFQKWKIMINTSKTQAIYFTRRRSQRFLPQVSLEFDNYLISWNQNVKYLGIILDPKLKFKDHIQYITKKTQAMIRILYPFINRRSNLSLDNKMLIFKSIFQAIFYYACPVWSKAANCHIQKLQVAQNKVLKLIHGLPHYYSTQRLHALAKVDLISYRLDKLSQAFISRCQSSSFEHINELVL